MKDGDGSSVVTMRRCIFDTAHAELKGWHEMPDYPEEKTIEDLKLHLSHMLIAATLWKPVHVNDLEVGRVFEPALSFDAKGKIVLAQLQAVSFLFPDDAKMTAEKQQCQQDMAHAVVQSVRAWGWPIEFAGIDRAAFDYPEVQRLLVRELANLQGELGGVPVVDQESG